MSTLETSPHSSPAQDKAPEQSIPKPSATQSSGVCLYKDKCCGQGQTLYVCVKCAGRFHHLCASKIGKSDEQNICREGCEGKARAAVPTPTVVTSSKSKRLQNQEYFVATPTGDNKPASEDEDDDDDVLAQANSRGTQQSQPAAGSESKKVTGKAKSPDKAPISRKSLPKTSRVNAQASTARHKSLEKPPTPVAEIISSSSSESDDDNSKDMGDDRGESSAKTGLRPILSGSGRQGGKTPRSSSTRPQRAPSPDSDPSILVGGRPTVNVHKPDHRRMCLPLMVKEPVVYEDENGKPCLGIVATTVERADELVNVHPMTKLGNYADHVIEGLDPGELRVVKATDYLIYIGARYAVFGPPLRSFAGLGWGAAWLDLLAERAFYHESTQAHDKMLYELKRLDVVMLKYVGVPECPVLVLGFLQNRIDDSDWKAIGVIGCDKPKAATKEEDALNNICFINIKDLKKEYEASNTYIVQETAEFYMTAHPQIQMYHQATSWIARWAKNNAAWSPPKSWKARLQKMYPQAFKALTLKAVEPKPCTSCTSLRTQLEKSNVS